MLRATLKSIRGHLGRTVATAAAVILGISFLAGTLIFTDSVQRAFDVSIGVRFQSDVVSPRLLLSIDSFSPKFSHGFKRFAYQTMRVFFPTKHLRQTLIAGVQLRFVSEQVSPLFVKPLNMLRHSWPARLFRPPDERQRFALSMVSNCKAVRSLLVVPHQQI